MKKNGYEDGYSATVQAMAGPIGTIIPPSIPMVIYALTANVSIGKLSLAGYIPGILMGAGLMILGYLSARGNGHQVEPRTTWAERWQSFKDSFWTFMMAVIIMGRDPERDIHRYGSIGSGSGIRPFSGLLRLQGPQDPRPSADIGSKRHHHRDSHVLRRYHIDFGLGDKPRADTHESS